MSRRHAEFRLEGNEFSVVDVGSLNGTYVNRGRLIRPCWQTATRFKSASSAWSS
ncbi:oxoglutarate dehydrogenase inhibitor [Mycobacterium ulcerans str. Harvey]|uniref:Oxoglutarate dehydrogenase inhibitor n=1 Tax=Mycobacterium ulcerans str. Harvey TaxID=1299332 RepID=A0ABN0QVH2_MYCUL|nr:oxoglutarate dehydrogenase inhibitor [Mycobacterium ulcerans str. Harvey]